MSEIKHVMVACGDRGVGPMVVDLAEGAGWSVAAFPPSQFEELRAPRGSGVCHLVVTTDFDPSGRSFRALCEAHLGEVVASGGRIVVVTHHPEALECRGADLALLELARELAHEDRVPVSLLLHAGLPDVRADARGEQHEALPEAEQVTRGVIAESVVRAIARHGSETGHETLYHFAQEVVR